MWMSELPPFVPFLIAALLALLTRGRLRAAIMLATPVLGGLHLWLDVTPGTTLTTQVLEFELVLMRIDRLSLLFGYLFHIAAFISVIFALHVRDTTAARRRPGLCRQRAWRSVRRRPDHAVHLLGTARAQLRVPGLGRAEPPVEPCRHPLPAVPGELGPAAAGRRPAALPADRFAGLRLHRPAGHQRLADLSRLRHQVRLPAAAQLADRRLPGSHTHRYGVPVRLHHQGGGVRAGTRLIRAPSCWCISAS